MTSPVRLMKEVPMHTHQADSWTLRSILVIIACGIGNIVGVTTIINATFSNFLIPVSTDLGWQRSQFSFVLTLLSLIGVVAYPLSGRLIDRVGARPVALVGNVLFGLSVAGLGLIPHSPPFVYLMFGLMGLLATLPSTVLFARIVSTWFFARRGVVLGLSGGVAFGIGGVIMPSVAQVMIEAFGWRGAYMGLGILVIAIGLPVFFFLLKEAPAFVAPVERGGVEPVGGMTREEAQRHPAFWLLFGGVAVGAGSISAIITHMVPLVAEHGGSMATALAALAGLYMVNAGWQTILGAVLDKVSTPRIAALFVLPGIAGTVLLGTTADPRLMIVGGLLVGLSAGTEYGLLPFCIPRYFGFRAYGEIYGWIFGAIMLLQGISPFVMDLAFEAAGSYRPALIVLGGTLFACSAVIAFLPRYAEQAVESSPGAGKDCSIQCLSVN